MEIEIRLNKSLLEAIRDGDVEVGDKVRIPNSTGCWDEGNRYFEILQIQRDDQGNPDNITNDYCTCGCYDRRRVGINIIKKESNQNIKEKIMASATSIKEKFLLAITPEPKKSFRKAGITNGDDLLTEEGRDIFLNWMLNKHQEEFKKEVVDPILAEDNKE